MVKGCRVEWGACSRTVAFGDTPGALAHWKDSIAVGFDSGNIAILDAVTGIQTSVLSKHTDWVGSLTFSLDGALLVSGSDDETVILWDIQTGGVIKSFLGHTHWVHSVSISQDHTTIASGSDDKTIRLWNVQTGSCCIIDGHIDNVNSVAFSPKNSKLLMSASSDHTIRQWDIDGHEVGPTYDGHHVAFSSDGAHFISWGKTAAVVQSSGSGAVVTKLHVPNESLICCCFSPDGKLVAGSAGNTIYIWDITRTDDHLVETFSGHTDLVTSLVFSSSLISASDDQSVKFWQIGVSTDPATTNSESITSPSVSIASVNLQANDGIAISSDLAGVVRMWEISTGLCKETFHTLAGASTKRDARLVDGRLVFVWCVDNKMHTWDSERGELQMLDAPLKHQTASLRISGDGLKVFLLDGKSIRAWSIQSGEAVGEVQLERKPRIGSLVLDGSKALVRFGRSRIQGWDFGIPGSAPTPLSNVPPPGRSYLSLSSSTGEEIIGMPRIKNTLTGMEVFRLPQRYSKPIGIQLDECHLVAGYDSGEILILDFNGMVPQ